MKNKVGIGLTYILRKTALVSSFAVPLVFAGCEPEPKDYAPEAEVEFNPPYGDAPLEVRFNATGKDLNGQEDIKTYKLHIDKEVINSSTPMDITRTFQNPGSYEVYGEVIDSKGLSDKTSVSYIKVYRGPFMEQSVSLNNDVEIKYSATLSKVDKAELKVKRDGVLVSTEEIKDVAPTGEDYNKTFSYTVNPEIKKGKYEFTLTSGNLENKSSTEILNSLPTWNFGNINIDLNENSQISTTLQDPQDKNPEDNRVHFVYVKSLDGKTQPTLNEKSNGYDLNITALPNQTGPYQLELEFGSTEGGLEKKTLQGNIIKDTRLKANPFVQPNPTKPIIWDNFSTTNQRNAYLDDRLYNYDKTDTMTYIPDIFVCGDFSTQWIINFNGFEELGFNPEEGLEKNGWHNIPSYFVVLRVQDKPAHSIDAVMIGNKVGEVHDWRFIEPETDSTYNINELLQKGVYKIVINYTYIKENEVQGQFLKSIDMLEFIPDGNGGWKDSGYRNPGIKLTEERGK